MNIYIAGPMSGIPDHNYPEFDRVAAVLRSEGHTVHSPADMSRDVGHAPNPDGSISETDWQSCLRMDLIRVLESADAIYVLKGWHMSRGAKLEVLIAQSVGIPVYESWDDRRLFLGQQVQTVAIG